MKMESIALETAGKSQITLWGCILLLVCLSSVSPGQHYAYVTNAGDFGGEVGDLSIIDLATHTVIATAPLGDYPQGVAVNPAGTAVYVANTGSSEFTVIDTATHTSTTLPAGPLPAGVAIHPNGRYIYLANIDFFGEGVNSTVSVIDRASNTIVADIACGNQSIGVEVHPDGTMAYVSNIGDGTLAVFDTETHEVLDRIVLDPVDTEGPSSPVPVVVHPQGTYVYVADRRGPTVWAVNTATHEVMAGAFGHSHVGIGINPEGTILYVPDFDDVDPNSPPQGTTVAVVNAHTLELITTIDGFNAPLDVSMHPDGKHLYVANMVDDTVSVIDAESYAHVATIPVGSNPHAYGECVGPGVPRLLKTDAAARLEAAKATIAADPEGVVSPQYAIQHIDTAIDAANLSLQEDLWSASAGGDLDPRRLQASKGSAVFEAEQTMVQAILDAIRRGWVTSVELRSELLAIIDEAVRADRVLAAVVIDDAIVGGAAPELIEQAQALLENGDASVKEAKIWDQTDQKASLLTNAITEYQLAWQAALQ